MDTTKVASWEFADLNSFIKAGTPGASIAVDNGLRDIRIRLEFSRHKEKHNSRVSARTIRTVSNQTQLISVYYDRKLFNSRLECHD